MRIIDLANFPQFTAINLLSDAGRIGGPVVVPNGCKVMLVWNLADGKQGRNVLGGTVAGGFQPTPAIAETIRSALVSGGTWTALAAFLSTGVSLARVELQDIRVAFQPVVASTGAATPGTSASPALPSEVAAVITLRTQGIGPQNRGRAYIPGWATNALAAGDVIAPAAVTALTNWIPTITTALSAGGLSWSLINPARAQYTGTTGTVHPARVAVMKPLTGAVVRDNHWDSQRRRGLK